MTNYDAVQILIEISVVLSTISLALLWEDQIKLMLCKAFGYKVTGLFSIVIIEALRQCCHKLPERKHNVQV
jgi:hypothetical protein